ncbi:hypothetical protein LAZ40_11650 [Cereibacter sphaeroides]|uniref:hypothetical protein n=1 Tax=Cereibacter sphaeroides TaxID=1063 RepID=UPI001F2FB0FF|nr:hypothetical protein [Cereibacter sphaeroides]MCE6959673.1 hypothetical protein [Cereibacter sphaeroides]MCE6974466.1 hypothetical protein [Cereibacter sphaeroides]
MTTLSVFLGIGAVALAFVAIGAHLNRSRRPAAPSSTPRPASMSRGAPSPAARKSGRTSGATAAGDSGSDGLLSWIGLSGDGWGGGCGDSGGGGGGDGGGCGGGD